MSPWFDPLMAGRLCTQEIKGTFSINVQIPISCVKTESAPCASLPPKIRENTEPNPIQLPETRPPPAPSRWAAPALGQGPPRHQHYPPQARIHAHRLWPVETCKYSPSQTGQQKGMASQGEPQYPRQRGPSRITKFYIQNLILYTNDEERLLLGSRRSCSCAFWRVPMHPGPMRLPRKNPSRS